jgi:hypothetical protein
MSTVHKTSRLNWFNNAMTTLFGNRRDTQRRRSRSRTLGMESLEPRVVLSADFVSGFAMGVDQKGPAIQDSAVDSAGNTYISGAFSGTVDFDQATVRADGSDLMTSSGISDGFVAKYGPDNSLLWTQRMGGAAMDYGVVGLNYDHATDLAFDNNGNVYVAGNYFGASTFGQFTVSPISSNAAYQDTFVAKLSADGDFQWVRTSGNSGQDDVGDVTVDASGNVVLAIYSGFSMDVKKYNSGGTLQWTKGINSGYANSWGVMARSIDVDGSGNIIVSGDFAGTVDFNPDPKKAFNVTGAPAPTGSSGTDRCQNAYVLKLSSAGTFSWVAPFIAKRTEISSSLVDGTSVDVSSTGEVFVSGRYSGAVDINPSSTVDLRLNASFVSGSFVAKLSSAGSLIWARSVGSDSGYVIAADMQSDSTGVYIVGSFSGAMDTGNPAMPLITAGDSDGFVIHMSNSGVTDWTYAAGGSGSDNIMFIDIASDGTLALAGTYRSTSLDFDEDGVPDLLGRTGTSFTPWFLVKLRRR